jgi:hypothetical protein
MSLVVAKILTWAAVILVVVWIISNPAKAGTDIHSWIANLVTFFQSLANG